MQQGARKQIMKITTEFKTLANEILHIIYNFLPEQEKRKSSFVNQFFFKFKQ